MFCITRGGRHERPGRKREGRFSSALCGAVKCSGFLPALFFVALFSIISPVSVGVQKRVVITVRCIAVKIFLLECGNFQGTAKMVLFTIFEYNFSYSILKIYGKEILVMPLSTGEVLSTRKTI